MSSGEHIHFVTGRLAESIVREIVPQVAGKFDFDYSIDVLPITVAALMTPKWIARHIKIPPEATRIMLPGYCTGNLNELADQTAVPVTIGPRDIRFLEREFGSSQSNQDYGDHNIEIIAEINHAPQLSKEEVLRRAKQLSAAGADVIDIGCEPGDVWNAVGDYVEMISQEGLRVSIDSLNPIEIEKAARAGAELVLSVNSANREYAREWGCEVVAIPDDPSNLNSLHDTVEFLDRSSVPYRLDPILNPIGCGFWESLTRYGEVRAKYPEAEIMMGIGNITELTDVDSAGINVLLLAICQELSIRSVLTTQVINWASTSVQECNLARKLVYYAVNKQIPPKHLEPNLVCLRDPKQTEFDPEFLPAMAKSIRDNNYRIVAQDEKIHVLSNDLHLADRDPFDLFKQLEQKVGGEAITSDHAFYLGFEMAKAAIALTLGKQYEQDTALRWGYLTVEEKHHHLTSKRPTLKNEDGA